MSNVKSFGKFKEGEKVGSGRVALNRSLVMTKETIPGRNGDFVLRNLIRKITVTDGGGTIGRGRSKRLVSAITLDKQVVIFCERRKKKKQGNCQ